jgi:hypothetical protein
VFPLEELRKKRFLVKTKLSLSNLAIFNKKKGGLNE